MIHHGLTTEQLELIREILAPYAAVISRVDLFGSRAQGTYRPYSDVDLVLRGNLDQQTVDRLWTLFSESALPFKVDILAYNLIHYPPLQAHIDQVSRTLLTHEDLKMAGQQHKKTDKI